MINNLMEAAKVELASIKITKSPTRLSVPVTAAIEIVKAEARDKEIEFGLDAVADGIMEVDEAQLIEVIVNLLTNAKKYSPAKTNIAISFEYLENTKTAEIRVGYFGLGVTQVDIDGAFQPFQRLSAKPTAGEGSTGLGLVIVKSVIEAQEGVSKFTATAQKQARSSQLDYRNNSLLEGLWEYGRYRILARAKPTHRSRAAREFRPAPRLRFVTG